VVGLPLFEENSALLKFLNLPPSPVCACVLGRFYHLDIVLECDTILRTGESTYLLISRVMNIHTCAFFMVRFPYSQVIGRFLMIFVVLRPAVEIHAHPIVFCLFLAWSLIEVIRSGSYPGDN
jgi:hypothetical protein